LKTNVRNINALVVLLLILFSNTWRSYGQFTAEFFLGSAWHLSMPLRVTQPGEQEIRLSGRYQTKPWKGAPYYAVRAGIKKWSAELVHLKAYLENPPPEIEYFEVSHGYNMLFINRSLEFHDKHSLVRVGLGLVIGHPEGRVRGKQIDPERSFLGGGYHLSGISFQCAVGLPLSVGQHWFVRPEAKLTAAWAKMPLQGGGFAIVPNIAVHTLFGLGYSESAVDE
jgi:hypothetical protein